MVQLLVDACICLTVCVCKNDESYADNENPIIKTKTKKEFATNEKKNFFWIFWLLWLKTHYSISEIGPDYLNTGITSDVIDYYK